MASSDVLAPATDMGAVTLAVADLDAMTRYYVSGVGLDVLQTGVDSVLLGRGARGSLELRHQPGLRHAASSSAGLFHTAVLFDSQPNVARAVYSVATKYPRSFTGSADHLVSKAFYFDDPEGNGVELYWDRPRSEWPRVGSKLKMASDPLDPNAFLEEHLGGAAPGDADAFVGHVHLKVGDIETARSFYVGIVGFETVLEFGDQALFVSAGGYHHHLGMNTWQSQGAGPRTPALGLGQVAIRIPDPDTLGALRERLADHRVSTCDDGHTVSFSDPWNNAVRASVAS